MAAQLGFKNVPKDTSSCIFCLELIKTRRFSSFSNRNKQSPTAPCYPAVLDFPHKCTLQMLLLAFEAFRLKCITSTVMTGWLDKNSMNYHMTESEFALSLWAKRLEALSEPVSQVFRDLSSAIRKTVDLTTHPFLYYVLCPHHQVLHLKIRKRKSYKGVPRHMLALLHDIFPPPSKADGKKINLPVTDLVHHMLLEGHLQSINDVFEIFPISTPETIVVMHLVNTIGIQHYTRLRPLIIADKACCMNPKQYNVYYKAIGVAVRRCARWVDGSELCNEAICQLSYLEMCMGRMTSTSDWEEERLNRCTRTAYLKMPHTEGVPSEMTNAEYLSHLRRHLYTIFDQLVQPEEDALSWPEFVKQRQLWISGGSAGGEKVTIDGETRRIDKKVQFESLERSEIISWLYKTPCISAVGSEKYEITKPRAIYGADSMCYMILTYLTRLMEFRMSQVEGFQDGLTDLEELDAINQRIKQVSQPGVYTTMVDYTDFNYQHTLACQSLMFEVMTQVMREKGMHPDMITAGVWAMRACLNQQVKFPYSDIYLKVIQGMFSGIRTTNFMNTILNKAYFMVADEYVRLTLKITPVDLYTIHKGDDVWITNKSLPYAIALFTTMQCSGLDFRPDKQLFGREGEFLRVRYWPGHAMGYVNRAIGTLTERPMQSQDMSTPAVMLHGLRSQINVCFRRGLKLEAANLIWDVFLTVWRNFKHPNFNNIYIPKAIICKDHVLGGLDLGPPMTLPRGGVISAPIPVEVRHFKNLTEQIASHMTNDFTQYMSEQLKKEFKIELVKRHLHTVNVSGAASNKELYISMKHLANDTRLWLDKLPKQEPTTRCQKAFSSFFDLDVSDKWTFDQLEMINNKPYDVKIPKEDTLVNNIWKAIHSSPYRDISTAQRATGASVIDAAKQCIYENANMSVRNNAHKAICSLEAALPRDILTRVLQGIRSAGNNFECILHPVAISWLSSVALNQAIDIAIYNEITNVIKWDRILKERQRQVIVAAYKQGMLTRMSYY